MKKTGNKKHRFMDQDELPLRKIKPIKRKKKKSANKIKQLRNFRVDDIENFELPLYLYG